MLLEKYYYNIGISSMCSMMHMCTEELCIEVGALVAIYCQNFWHKYCIAVLMYVVA